MSRWRCEFPGSRWDVPTARNDLPLYSLFKGIGSSSKPRTVHGIAIRLCRGRQRDQSASFGTDDGAIRDRQKSFRGRDSASSVDEQPKSPRDARASVSERFDITRDHTTTTQPHKHTKQHESHTRFQCRETLVFKRQAKASSHARIAPANSHTRSVVLCFRTLPKHTW